MAVVAQSSVIRRVWIRAPQFILYIIIIATHSYIYIPTFLSSSLNNIRNFRSSIEGSKNCTHNEVETQNPVNNCDNGTVYMLHGESADDIKKIYVILFVRYACNGKISHFRAFALSFQF